MTLVGVSSRTDPDDDDVVDVTSFSKLDVVEIKSMTLVGVFKKRETARTSAENEKHRQRNGVFTKRETATTVKACS